MINVRVPSAVGGYPPVIYQESVTVCGYGDGTPGNGFGVLPM